METLNITMQNGDVHTTEFRLTDGRKLTGVASATINLAVAQVPTVQIELSALSEFSFDGVASNVFVLTGDEMLHVLSKIIGHSDDDTTTEDLLRVRNLLNDAREGRES